MTKIGSSKWVQNKVGNLKATPKNIKTAILNAFSDNVNKTKSHATTGANTSVVVQTKGETASQPQPVSKEEVQKEIQKMMKRQGNVSQEEFALLYKKIHAYMKDSENNVQLPSDIKWKDFYKKDTENENKKDNFDENEEDISNGNGDVPDDGVGLTFSDVVFEDVAEQDRVKERTQQNQKIKDYCLARIDKKFPSLENAHGVDIQITISAVQNKKNELQGLNPQDADFSKKLFKIYPDIKKDLSEKTAVGLGQLRLAQSITSSSDSQDVYTKILSLFKSNISRGQFLQACLKAFKEYA